MTYTLQNLLDTMRAQYPGEYVALTIAKWADAELVAHHPDEMELHRLATRVRPDIPTSGGHVRADYMVVKPE